MPLMAHISHRGSKETTRAFLADAEQLLAAGKPASASISTGLALQALEEQALPPLGLLRKARILHARCLEEAGLHEELLEFVEVACLDPWPAHEADRARTLVRGVRAGLAANRAGHALRLAKTCLGTTACPEERIELAGQLCLALHKAGFDALTGPFATRLLLDGLRLAHDQAIRDGLDALQYNIRNTANPGLMWLVADSVDRLDPHNQRYALLIHGIRSSPWYAAARTHMH